MPTDLNVVIPVYNEEEIIQLVIEDWVANLEPLHISYKITLYNDGSTDSTLKVLQELKQKYNGVVEVVDKKNSGHGPTILKGYTENLDSTWLFQVDSDNEMKARYFKDLWDSRDNYDLLIGKRVNRASPIFRQIMSFVSYLTVRSFYGSGVRDVNCPYRLMRTTAFRNILLDIPANTFAPNVIISGMACRHKLRIKSFDIPFDTRETGVNSLNSKIFKLFRIAYRSYSETVNYARQRAK